MMAKVKIDLGVVRVSIFTMMFFLCATQEKKKERKVLPTSHHSSATARDSFRVRGLGPE